MFVSLVAEGPGDCTVSFVVPEGVTLVAPPVPCEFPVLLAALMLTIVLLDELLPPTVLLLLVWLFPVALFPGVLLLAILLVLLLLVDALMLLDVLLLLAGLLDVLPFAVLLLPLATFEEGFR